MTIRDFGINGVFGVNENTVLVEVKYYCENGGFMYGYDIKEPIGYVPDTQPRVDIGIKSCQSLFEELEANWNPTENIEEKKWQPLREFDYKNSTETIKYILSKRGNGWKITSAYLPHISTEIFEKRSKQID